MDKPPFDVIISGNSKLGISANCEGYGKSALFQTCSVLEVDNPCYESDFMSRVHFEYDKLSVKFNISTIINDKHQHMHFFTFKTVLV